MSAPHPVSLAAVVWDFPLVGRTRMLCESWAGQGVANTFVQVPSRRDALQRWTQGPRQAVSSTQWVVRPGGGFFSRGILAPASARRAARRLRSELGASFRWEESVGLIVNPLWEPWLDELPFGKVVYDCIDELRVHAPDPRRLDELQRREGRLLSRCDGAITTARVLSEGLLQRRPGLQVAMVRNGVDDVRFRERASGASPADARPGGRETVGFVGALYEWIDWSLIREVACAMPEVDLVFVGPRAPGTAGDSVARLNNVYLLGPRAYDQVPLYISAFDVCWVPFLVDEIGVAANPVKIYEYLALEKPVCSTSVADLDAFDGLVARADGAEQMIEALRTALEEGALRAVARRKYAAKNSWRARAEDVLDFCTKLSAT